jgi:UMF1 family MFS transporter
LIILIAIMFEFSAVFHNAMLPSIAPESKVGSISGLALALGNVGGLLLMVFVLFAFALPGTVDWSFIPDAPLFGLDQDAEEHNRIVGPLTAIWLLVFGIPLFLFTPDGKPTESSVKQVVVQGLSEVWATVKAVSHYSNVARYLIARMIFNDGLVGILIFSGVYAAGIFGWGSISLLIFGIVTSLSAAIGAVIGGAIDDKFGSRTAILIAVGGTAVLLVVGVSLQPDSIFYLVDLEPGKVIWNSPYFQTLPEVLYFLNTQLFGMFITVGFASARTMMARISPPELITQFFGLYALSGTATAFLAPLLVGFFTNTFESQRAGLASLIGLLVVGFILMLFVKEERSTKLEVV